MDKNVYENHSDQKWLSLSNNWLDSRVVMTISIIKNNDVFILSRGHFINNIETFKMFVKYWNSLYYYYYYYNNYYHISNDKL